MAEIKQVKVGSTTYDIQDTRIVLPLPIASGGTGATTAALARTALGVTDKNVEQNPITTNASIPILTKATNAVTAVTGTVGFATTAVLNPNVGLIKVSGPGASDADSATGFALAVEGGSKNVASLSKYREGTASTTGVALLQLGNNTAEGTAGNATGSIYLYGTNSRASMIKSGVTNTTSSRSVVFPDTAGWIAVGGDGSSSGEGGASTPIYMDTNGELKPVTSINSSLISGDLSDTKVSQNTLSTNATFPLVIKGTSATVSVTGTVGFTTAIYSNPNKSNITVQGPANSSSASGAALRVLPANGNTTVATLMNYEEGTASSVGTGAVVVGNAVASGNVGNAKGLIILYGENKYSSRITSAADSSSKNQTLPNKEGWIPVGGDGSSSGEGSSSTPIYMAADGELKPVTSIDSSLYEDQYVKQTETDGSNFYPILTTATSIGSASGTLTGSARYNTGVRIAHGVGTVISEATAGTMVGVNSGGFKVNNKTTIVAGMWHAVEGTASAVGYGSAVVGNSTASGTAGNAAGRIYVYGTSTGRNLIVSDVTNGSSPTNYLPNATGYLAVGSTAGVGTSATPVYMSSSGVLTKVSSIDNSLLPVASTNTSGIVTYTAATQTFGGKKRFNNTVYFGSGDTGNSYYLGSSGSGRFQQIGVSSITTNTYAGASITMATYTYFAQKIIGKSGTATASNYSTSVPAITSNVPTGQIMFVIQ